MNAPPHYHHHSSKHIAIRRLAATGSSPRTIANYLRVPRPLVNRVIKQANTPIEICNREKRYVRKLVREALTLPRRKKKQRLQTIKSNWGDVVDVDRMVCNGR